MSKAGAPKQSIAIQRVTVADGVADRLREMILAQELSDGTPLRQDALAAEMGTSRIPVREALSRLETEGLVASYPHRGYVVTGLSQDEIIELFDLRSLLEPELVKYSIPNMMEADFDRAYSILEAFEKALVSDEIHIWGELNRQFHLALYAPSGRTRTLEIVRGLLLNSDRYTRLVLSVGEDGLRLAQEDHRRMLDLCKRGAINQAEALTRDHILDVRSHLLGIFNRDK